MVDYKLLNRLEMGKRIRYARKRLMKTQQELADLVGTQQTIIARYENGKAVPRDETLKNIATALNIDYLYLKYGESSEYVIESIEVGTRFSINHICADNVYAEQFLSEYQNGRINDVKNIDVLSSYLKSILKQISEDDRLLLLETAEALLFNTDEYAERTNKKIERLIHRSDTDDDSDVSDAYNYLIQLSGVNDPKK